MLSTSGGSGSRPLAVTSTTATTSTLSTAARAIPPANPSVSTPPARRRTCRRSADGRAPRDAVQPERVRDGGTRCERVQRGRERLLVRHDEPAVQRREPVRHTRDADDERLVAEVDRQQAAGTRLVGDARRRDHGDALLV